MVEILGPLEAIYHFRILGNKLYKYIPEGAPFSDTDTATEKALKTLLLYAQVPDMDFALCGLDGIPEHYFPSDFYLTGNPETQAPVFAQAVVYLIQCGYATGSIVSVDGGARII